MTSGSIRGEMKAKKEAGRPTNYTKEILRKAKEYLNLPRTTDTEEQIPTVEGLSLCIGVSRATIYNWIKEGEKEKKEFLDTVEKVLAKQGQSLINKGLSGDFAPTIAKLLLSSNHGMREKTEIEHDIKDGFYERFSGVSTEDLKKQTKKLIDDEE